MKVLCSMSIMFNYNPVCRVIVEDVWCREEWHTAKEDCNCCKHPAAGIFMSLEDEERHTIYILKHH